MNNKIIYSSQQETDIIRISDVVPAIETSIGLKVIDVLEATFRSGQEEAKSSFYDERFPDEKPLALWWFHVTFDSSEGKRSAMVLLALEKSGLRVIHYDFPRLMFYNRALRTRALEEASELTREYLEQLETALLRAHSLWKAANEYAETCQGLRGDLFSFHEEFRKVGYLGPDGKDGRPQGLGLRKLYLPDSRAKFPGQYITGDDDPPFPSTDWP